MLNKVTKTATPAPIVEFVTLEIDGEVYSLGGLDFNAIADAELVAKCNLLLGIAGMLTNGMTAQQTRGLLYASLRRAHPKITLQDAGNLVRVDTLPDINDALLRAYNASLPEGKKILKERTEDSGKSQEGQG